MIDKGDRHEGLYVLHTNNIQAEIASLEINLINNICVHTWHSRLGHLSFKQLHVLKSQMRFDDSQFKFDICFICPLAKHRRLPFASIIICLLPF